MVASWRLVTATDGYQLCQIVCQIVCQIHALVIWHVSGTEPVPVRETGS